MKGTGARRLAVLGGVVVAAAACAGSASATFPGGNGKLAVVVFDDEYYEASDLITIDESGANEANLTADFDGIVWDAAWSPDGTQIAFTEIRESSNEEEPLRWALWVMNDDGTSRRRLTTFTGFYPTPAWSPDGSTIVFSRANAAGLQLYEIAVDGSSYQALTRFTRIAPLFPSWSPDGETIAFTGLRFDDQSPPSIFLMDEDGTNVRRLTGGMSAWAPDWAPDGSKILFTADSGFFTIGPDGDPLTRIYRAAGETGYASWSPDGSRIAFGSSVWSRSGGIGVMNADGTCAAPVDDTSGIWGTHWQPLPGVPASGPIQCADLTVTAKATPFAQVGETYTVDVTVKNSGNSPADDTRLEAPLPPDTTYVGATPSTGSCSGPPIVCDLGTLAGGAEATVELVFHADAAGYLDAWVEASTSSNDRDLSRNEALHRTVACDRLGGPAADRLVGTSAPEFLCGGGGGDTIVSRGGEDYVLGGGGADRVSGGDGADRIDGGAGADVVNGGTGDDALRGRDGNDAILGRRGKDLVLGGPGADAVAGGNGDDTVLGGGGRDRMFGGGGRDFLDALDRMADRVSGGRGLDFAVVDRRDRVYGVERREGPWGARASAEMPRGEDRLSRVFVRSPGVLALR